MNTPMYSYNEIISIIDELISLSKKKSDKNLSSHRLIVALKVPKRGVEDSFRYKLNANDYQKISIEDLDFAISRSIKKTELDLYFDTPVAQSANIIEMAINALPDIKHDHPFSLSKFKSLQISRKDNFNDNSLSP